MEEKLIYNAVKTPDGTVLHSKHNRDFVIHKDKNGKEYGIDGGNSYRRLIGDHQDCEDLSIYDDGKHETRRKYFCWGKNFDKDMNRLPKTEWITIENMTTDHIQAIVDGGWVDNNPYYSSIFKEELKFRENE